uniref:Uncharacterized protein n=3 Tax=Kryptolebias marmoratus TaxID=37003 RepID=A0A3Q3B9G5_KRYMA
MPMPFISGASKPEKDNTSYWSHNSQDDPYRLCFTQTSIKNRKPTDKADCDSEVDLQGLVSNILDEADSRDSFFSESLPMCKPLWSPKTLREELLQYFKTEAKTLNNPSNHLSHETFSKAQQHLVDKVGDELSQSSGLAGNQQWLFNLPNGDDHSPRPQKLPPGLPVLKMMNTNPSQMQQSKYISMLPYIDRGNDQTLNSFPELSDIFRQQNEMNGSSFDSFHEDQYTKSSLNPFSNENYVPEDVNQLVSSFQSFMPCDDSICHEEFPNMHKQTLGSHKDQGLPEHWNITSPTMQIQKQLLGDLGSVQRGKIGEMKKKQFKLDAFQDLPDFSSQHMEYFPKPKGLSSHLNFTNHHQSKTAMQRENFNLSMNQYAKHQIQQSQMQAKIKSQMEREKMKMQMSGFLGDGFSRRQQSNAHMTEGNKCEQNPYFDFQGNMQYQRLDGENTVVCSGTPQQFTPLMYPAGDLRRYSSTPMNSNFNCRSSLLCENGVPGVDKSGLMSPNEAAAFNSVVSDMKTYRGENTYHGMVSAMAASLTNHGGPVMQLYFYLDECYEQFRSLEKDRKRTEIILKKTFPGKRTTAMTNTNLPRTPPNPKRLDQLIGNQMREQAKVASLLDRMECFCGISLHMNIHTALKNHHMAVCITQARCKEGSSNLTKTQQQGMNFTEERDNLLIAVALKDLSAATRRLRTALWSALQTTLPKPVTKQDHHAYEEPTCTERCSFLFQGYSFWI